MLLRGLLLIFAISISSAFAEESTNSYYEVSNLYHQRAHRVSCEFVKSRVNEIKAKKNDEIKHELTLEIERLSELKKEAPTKEEKRDLKKIIRSLKKIRRKLNPKNILVKSLESICTGIKEPVGAFSRLFRGINSFVVNIVALPFGSIFNFFKGLFSRTTNDLGERSDFLYRALGPQKGVPTYILSSLALKAPNLFLKTSATFPIISTNVAVEMITNYLCHNQNEYNKPEVEFCDAYDRLKNFFHSAHKASFNYGHKLQELFDKKLIEERKNFDPKEYCSFSTDHQIKIAKAVSRRHGKILSEDERIIAFEIAPPVTFKNDCTKFIILTENEEILENLKMERTHIEGIEIVYVVKGNFPSNLYYNSEERSEMLIEEQICHDVQMIHYRNMLSNKWKTIGTMIKSSIAPSMLGNPEHEKIEVIDELVKQNSIEGMRNLIFSIAPSSADIEKAKTMANESDEISKRLKKNFRHLKKLKNYHQCMAQIYTVDVKQAKRDSTRFQEIQKSNLFLKYYTYLGIKQYFEKANKHLKLKWELIETNNLQTISEALSAPNVANIVIISHGKKSGHLVDSSGQELPRGAFANISPSIQSINFYSCYSQELSKLYSLKNKLTSQPSFYKIRYITTVQTNNFMDGSQFAPVAAFSHYLKKVDQYLYKATQGAELLQESFGHELSKYHSDPLCKLDITDAVIKEGSYGIVLNNSYIGSFSKDRHEGELTFPCKYLNRKDTNILKIMNILNSSKSSFENLATFKLRIEDMILTPDYSPKIRLNSLIIYKFNYRDL